MSTPFLDACSRGDAGLLREFLTAGAHLAQARDEGGFTALHLAARSGHLDVVRLLLQHGADPNAREPGDNTYPLHWAAAGGHTEIVRALLDAGGDPHGLGDVHQLDAIGWATLYHAPDREPGSNPEVVALLLQRGARHHIFSAIAANDFDVIRRLAAVDPEALQRRLSRFEKGQSPLHYAISLKRYPILDLLIELGVDLEATDQAGQTALTLALVHGDSEAARRLQAAGAKPPESVDAATLQAGMAQLAASVHKSVSMISVPDVAAALDWYAAIGFTEQGRVPEGGVANWGMVSFGGAELMLIPGGAAGRHDVSLWFYTSEVDQLYHRLRSGQVAARIEFVEELYEPFYGGREFGVRDLNGYQLFFLQPAD